MFGDIDCLTAELTYTPKDKVIEHSVFRDFFNKQFNQTMESIAVDCFNFIDELIHPEHLTITIELIEQAAEQKNYKAVVSK